MELDDQVAHARRLRTDAIVGAVGRIVGYLLPDRGHHGVDGALAGLDRCAQASCILVHRDAELFEPGEYPPLQLAKRGAGLASYAISTSTAIR